MIYVKTENGSQNRGIFPFYQSFHKIIFAGKNNTLDTEYSNYP